MPPAGMVVVDHPAGVQLAIAFAAEAVDADKEAAKVAVLAATLKTKEKTRTTVGIVKELNKKTPEVQAKAVKFFVAAQILEMLKDGQGKKLLEKWQASWLGPVSLTETVVE